MFGRDYQVLDIDYAVAERHPADITQIKELATLSAVSPLSVLSVLFLSEHYTPCS
jgi:hypothetical protein